MINGTCPLDLPSAILLVSIIAVFLIVHQTLKHRMRQIQNSISNSYLSDRKGHRA